MSLKPRPPARGPAGPTPQGELSNDHPLPCLRRRSARALEAARQSSSTTPTGRAAAPETTLCTPAATTYRRNERRDPNAGEGPLEEGRTAMDDALWTLHQYFAGAGMAALGLGR